MLKIKNIEKIRNREQAPKLIKAREEIKIALKEFKEAELAYKEIEDYENAIKNFKRAIELNPNYAEAYNNLGIIFKKKYKCQ